jgi:hypothetical protein
MFFRSLDGLDDMACDTHMRNKGCARSQHNRKKQRDPRYDSRLDSGSFVAPLCFTSRISHVEIIIYAEVRWLSETPSLDRHAIQRPRAFMKTRPEPNSNRCWFHHQARVRPPCRYCRMWRDISRDSMRFGNWVPRARDTEPSQKTHGKATY